MPATAKDVLQELDALRTLLAQPFADLGSPVRYGSDEKYNLGTNVHLGSPYGPTPAADEPGTAERLGRAIEAAEQEVDAAAGRAQEVQRGLLRQKEQEIGELRRVISSKDRAVDALRDQLAGLRHSYEQRLAATEAAACGKESEAGKLRAELLAAHAERDDMATRLRDADAAAAALEADAAAQAGALGASLQAQGRELAAAAAAAQRGQQDKELLLLEVQELRRELDAAEAAARAARAQAAAAAEQCAAEAEARRVAEVELDEARAQIDFMRESKELEVSELRRRLRAEHGVRKACERWLRTELRSREEMEALLLAVRDTAFGRPPRREDEVRGVELLLDSLRSSAPESCAATGRAPAAAPRARAAAPSARGPPGRPPQAQGRGARGGGGAAACGGAEADGPWDGGSGGGGGGGGDADGGAGAGAGAGAGRLDFGELRRQLRGDGARLKEQVAAAKALLRDRLGRGPAAGG